jgi:uncharacterized protein (TIGR02453 family)
MAVQAASPVFEGFPGGAFAFYAELEEPDNNSKAWFEANRARYLRDVRGPLEALLAAAAPEFGTHTKVFRPHRDVRFSPDKRPYKTNAAALITMDGLEGAASFYLSLDAEGLAVGVGYGGFSREQLQRYRDAVDDDRTGAELAALVEAARDDGFEVGGRTLVRGPRGVAPDHPRLDLLCHTTMTLLRAFPEDEVAGTPAAAELVFGTWRDGTPVARWLTRHLAGGGSPR